MHGTHEMWGMPTWHLLSQPWVVELVTFLAKLRLQHSLKTLAIGARIQKKPESDQGNGGYKLISVVTGVACQVDLCMFLGRVVRVQGNTREKQVGGPWHTVSTMVTATSSVCPSAHPPTQPQGSLWKQYRPEEIPVKIHVLYLHCPYV